MTVLAWELPLLRAWNQYGGVLRGQPPGTSHALLTTLPPACVCAWHCATLQGSLASGTFAAYSPVTREAEVCDVQPAAGEGMDVEEEEEEAEEQQGGELEGEPV
jgi:hypothetical protein